MALCYVITAIILILNDAMSVRGIINCPKIGLCLSDTTNLTAKISGRDVDGHKDKLKCRDNNTVC